MHSEGTAELKTWWGQISVHASYWQNLCTPGTGSGSVNPDRGHDDRGGHWRRVWDRMCSVVPGIEQSLIWRLTEIRYGIGFVRDPAAYFKRSSVLTDTLWSIPTPRRKEPRKTVEEV